MIFDLFTPAGRGVANGVFSWGIYFGYALAYILGITAVDADILGHGWRSVYVMCSIPGFAIGISILLFLQDPKYQRLTSTNNSEVSTKYWLEHFLQNKKCLAFKKYLYTNMATCRCWKNMVILNKIVSGTILL